MELPGSGTGHHDKERYIHKVDEALKKRLDSVITGENVITAPNGKTVRIRVPDIHEPRFRYRDKESKQTGVGAGEDKDPIARIPPQGDGRSGRQAGEGHEASGIIVDVPVEQVAAWVFEQLHLPNLQKRHAVEEDTEDTLSARGKQGAILDKKRTLLRHLQREMIQGAEGPWRQDDLIYRRWSDRPKPVFQAVVMFVRDDSGSITEDMQYIIRVTCWWTVLWLRHSYPHVDVRFVIFDDGAREVGEEEFFNQRDYGGTRISTGLQLADTILDVNYPEDDWNRYLLLFSDGDTFGDEAEVSKLVRKMAQHTELVAYGHLAGYPNAVYETWKNLRAQYPTTVRAAVLLHRDDIRGWLQQVFGTAIEQPKAAKAPSRR